MNLAYVSPSTKDNSTIADAVADHSGRELLKAEGITPGIGFWSDGAEVSGAFHDEDASKLLRRVAELGKRWRQKGIIAFSEQKHGADLAHVIRTAETDPHKLDKELGKAGVEYKTIVPHPYGSTIHVLDQGGQLEHGLREWAKKTNGKIRTFRGRVHFVGHEDRDMAQHEFDRVLNGEQLVGGKADGKPDSDFDQKEVARGQRVESEHTGSPSQTKEIAKDHLTEDPKYYQKLAKVKLGRNESIGGAAMTPTDSTPLGIVKTMIHQPETRHILHPIHSILADSLEDQGHPLADVVRHTVDTAKGMPSLSSDGTEAHNQLMVEMAKKFLHPRANRIGAPWVSFQDPEGTHGSEERPAWEGGLIFHHLPTGAQVSWHLPEPRGSRVDRAAPVTYKKAFTWPEMGEWLKRWPEHQQNKLRQQLRAAINREKHPVKLARKKLARKLAHRTDSHSAALATSYSVNNGKRREIAMQILKEAGLQPAAVRNVLLHEKGKGVKSTVMTAIQKRIDPKLAGYVASWFGLLAREKALTVFHPHESGQDRLHVLQTGMDPAALGEYMSGAGVPKFLIEEAHPGSRAYVYSPQGQFDSHVQRVVGGTNASHSQFSGTGFRLGSGPGSDADARADYRGTISSFEAQATGGATKPPASSGPTS